ncbi:Protein of unknown function DUF115 [Thalassovita gelatinovora]|uniref:6-hydroxymethylpterin diphosphokinase MptE-like protein n=1 Tax=Thalassovita gelatinovora TaxID=53501 RepID=UPI0008BBC48B|nr:6-hydroxymethylpterin diphosphokinase MptE-like protein [Thalassovita gelatinovora]QIZ82674.1 DUF115 domain-containing protein [Thalassovita gelatinovora]SER11440.1 Protein of unknown function DUF115 [Thalassovita gelatinovora]
MRFDCSDPTSPLLRFHDQHPGQRCVIVCNGPSLNKMDLGFLRDEIVFGLNKIYLGLERFGFYPRYMVAVNRKVIAQSADRLRAMNCVKFISDRGADLMPRDALTYHIRTQGMEKQPQAQRFYRDVTEGVREGHTVTHAALQLAYFMGFSQVVIIGMDHNFPQSGAPNSELVMQGDDPNHFSPAYFRGAKWDAPNLAESEISYRAALAAYRADGRAVVDATQGGLCDVFPKADYRAVFGL